MSWKTDTKYFDNVNKIKHRCKHCGRKQVIPNFENKTLCDWCGHNIYKSDKDEFVDRVSIELNKIGGILDERKING